MKVNKDQLVFLQKNKFIKIFRHPSKILGQSIKGQKQLIQNQEKVLFEKYNNHLTKN